MLYEWEINQTSYQQQTLLVDCQLVFVIVCLVLQKVQHSATSLQQVRDIHCKHGQVAETLQQLYKTKLHFLGSDGVNDQLLREIKYIEIVNK